MKYTLNKNYFKIIDSEDKAYFLGLLYADGYNYSNGKSQFIKISLQKEDIGILNQFQKFIGSNYPITTINRSQKNINWSDIVGLQINSKTMSNDLTNLNCIQAKSKILTFPNENIIPKNLINHFIRGYFDGDGSIWDGKRKKMLINDKKSKSGKRIRIIHNVKFNITGTVDLVKGIQEILINELLFKPNKLNRSKKIEYCVQLEYSGRKQIKKFYDFLYENSSVYLQRKKDKFESIINYKNEKN